MRETSICLITFKSGLVSASDDTSFVARRGSIALVSANDEDSVILVRRRARENTDALLIAVVLK